MRRRFSSAWENVEPAITPSQCCAARAAMHIGLRDLATVAGISPMTISRFENGHASVTPEAVRTIRTALERKGAQIELVAPNHRFTNADP